MADLSQKELILQHLKEQPITPIQALDLYGCFRLSARIKDLKDDGHRIRTEDVETRTGKHIARYHLERDGEPLMMVFNKLLKQEEAV